MKSLELAYRLATLNGMTSAQTDYLVRLLRQEDLLPATKRGYGAKDCDPRGAASLLMATMTNALPADAVRAVQVLGSLKPLRRGGFGNPMIGILGRVAEADTFGLALARLIKGAPKLKRMAMELLMLAYQTRDPALLTEDNVDLLFSLELTLQLRPAPHASLVLRSPTERGIEVIEHRQEWVLDAKLLAEGFYNAELRDRSDLRVRSTISHKTLFRLGDLLAADSTEEHDNETARTEGEAVPQGRGHATASQQGGDRKPGSIGYRESGLRLPQR